MTIFCALLLLWALVLLPVSIAVSLWAVYRVCLGGRLGFWAWGERLINRH